MSLSVWQRNIVTEAGDVIPDAEIEVFDAGSSSKPDLFSDPDGNSSITNPFNADSNGFARFYVSGGRYDIAVNGAVLWEDVALGTTQRRDTGPAPSEVPTNDDANERGFAQTVDSVSDLRTSTFPASLQRLWLSGYYGVGTTGGGPLYRKGTGFVSADENGILWVDADGVGWEAGPGFVLAEDASLRVPSRFATLQEAIDGTIHYQVTQGAAIDLLIESGHRPASGIIVEDGDYGQYRISAEDADVPLDENWQSTTGFLTARRARAPTLNCLIDMSPIGSAAVTNEETNGYFCDHASTGFVTEGSGVKNCPGRRGIGAFRGSSISAEGAIATGCAHWAIVASRDSHISAIGADASDSLRGFYAARVSTITANESTANSCGQGYIARRGSTLFCPDSQANDCVGPTDSGEPGALIAAAGARIVGGNVTAQNCDNGAHASGMGEILCFSFDFTGANYHVLYAQDGSKVSATGGVAPNSGSELTGSLGGVIEAFSASTVDAGGVDVSNALHNAIWAARGSTINANTANVSGSDGDGVFAARGSTINAHDVNASDVTGTGADVSNGGVINANGLTGTLGKTANQVTSNGIIFQ